MTEEGMFNVEVWGTVGQWFGAVATLAVAILSLWFSQAGARLARNQEAEKHIRSLAIAIEERNDLSNGVRTKAIATVMNAGVAPLEKVAVSLREYDAANTMTKNVDWKVGVLRPGDDATCEIPAEVHQESDYTLSCMDVNGVRWQKTRDGAISCTSAKPRRWFAPWRRG